MTGSAWKGPATGLWYNECIANAWKLHKIHYISKRDHSNSISLPDRAKKAARTQPIKQNYNGHVN